MRVKKAAATAGLLAVSVVSSSAYAQQRGVETYNPHDLFSEKPIHGICSYELQTCFYEFARGKGVDGDIVKKGAYDYRLGYACYGVAESKGFQGKEFEKMERLNEGCWPMGNPWKGTPVISFSKAFDEVAHNIEEDAENGVAAEVVWGRTDDRYFAHSRIWNANTNTVTLEMEIGRHAGNDRPNVEAVFGYDIEYSKSDFSAIAMRNIDLK